jgi:hypothetical protein
MTKLQILGLLVGLSQAAWGDPPPAASGSPAVGPTIGTYLDKGTWTPLQSAAGDLNGDSRDDVAVALERKYGLATTEPEYRRPRGLLVLFATAEGKYVQAALVSDLLPCTSCLGTLSAAGSEAFDMEITDGRLTIGWMAGGAELKSVRLTFAYDEEAQALALIADDKITFDPQRRTRTRMAHDYVAGRMEIDDRSFTGARKFIPITAVSASQY